MVQINDALWPGLTEVASKLPTSEDSFLEGEFGGNMTPKYYRDRLTTIGFVGMDHVLDAGCGMGQWSEALARLNGEVLGIDPSERRLKVAEALIQSGSLGNANFAKGVIEDLPLADDAADGVFCYGVLMFADVDRSLGEFARVLKPGGLLYVNANDIGWYLHLLFDRGLRKRSPYLVKQSLKMMMAPLVRRRRDRLVTSGQLRRLLQRNGFSLLAMGPEGTVTHPNQREVRLGLSPKYPSKIYGFRGIVEALCVRV